MRLRGREEAAMLRRCVDTRSSLHVEPPGKAALPLLRWLGQMPLPSKLYVATGYMQLK